MKRVQQEPLSLMHHGLTLRRSNAAKSSVLRNLFYCFVCRIRSPTGRTKGKRLFRLPSYIKRYAPTIPRSNVQYEAKMEQSLLKRFQMTLDILFDHGNYDSIIYRGCLRREISKETNKKKTNKKKKLLYIIVIVFIKIINCMVLQTRYP